MCDGLSDNDKRAIRLFSLLQDFYGLFVSLPWFTLFPPFSSNGKFPFTSQYQILTAINLNKEGVERDDQVLNGVQVSIFRPAGSDRSIPLPAVVYFHGGGFVFMSPQYVEPSIYELIRKTGVIVVNVDYRQPPDHPFPAAFDDCRLVTEYVVEHGDGLGIDTKRVAVMGDSAGGNLAATVGQAMRERIKLQVIIYPMGQAFTFNLPSHMGTPLQHYCPPEIIAPCWLTYANVSLEHLERFLADRHLSASTREKIESIIDVSLIADKVPEKQMVSFEKRKAILRQKHSKQFPDSADQKRWENIFLDPRFNPLAQTDFTRLAPVYFISCTCDPIRDDGLLYLKRLEVSNVPVVHRHYDGFHGVFHQAAYRGYLQLEVGKKMLNDLANHLTKHL